MADEGLIVDLVIDQTKADRAVDAFVDKTKKKLAGVKFQPFGGGNSGGGSGSGGAIDRELDQNLREKTRKIEAANREREELNRRHSASMKRIQENEISDRRRAFVELKEIDQQEINSRNEVVARAEAAYQRIQRAQHEQMERAKTTFLLEKDGIEDMNASKWRTIIDQDRRADAIREGMARRSARVRAMIESTAGGAIGTGTPAGSKASSKNTMMLFQVQQAVEDFSFAGLRGAANNIALVASNLGGRAGLIALYGLTAAAIAPMVAGLIDSSAEMLKQIDILEKMERAHRDLQKAMMDTDAEIDQRQRSAFADFRKTTLTDGQRSANEVFSGALKRLFQGDMRDEAIREFRQMFDKSSGKDEILGVAVPGEVSRLEADKRKLQLDRDLIASQIRRRLGAAGIGGAVLESDVREIPGFFEGPGTSLEGRLNAGMKIPGNVRSAVGEEKIDELVRVNKEIEEAEQRMQRLSQRTSELGSTVVNKAIAGDLQATELLQKLLDKRANRDPEMQKVLASLREEEKLVRRIEQGMTAQEVAQSNASRELIRENALHKQNLEELEKKRKQGQDIVDLAIEERERHDHVLAVLEAQRDIEKDRLKTQKERLGELKREQNEVERLIEQERRKAQAAREGRQSSRDAFEGGAFDLMRGRNVDIAQRQAAHAKARLSPFLPDEVRGILEQNIDRHFQQVAHQRDAMLLEARGKFLSDQANMAGAAGNSERQRELLQELQNLQMGVAAGDPSMSRAQAAFEAAKRTQQAIEQTFVKEQQAAEQQLSRLEASNANLVSALDRLAAAIREQTKPKMPDDGPAVAEKPPTPAEMAGQGAAEEGLRGALGGEGGGGSKPKTPHEQAQQYFDALEKHVPDFRAEAERIAAELEQNPTAARAERAQRELDDIRNKFQNERSRLILGDGRVGQGEWGKLNPEAEDIVRDRLAAGRGGALSPTPESDKFRERLRETYQKVWDMPAEAERIEPVFDERTEDQILADKIEEIEQRRQAKEDADAKRRDLLQKVNEHRSATDSGNKTLSEILGEIRTIQPNTTIINHNYGSMAPGGGGIPMPAIPGGGGMTGGPNIRQNIGAINLSVPTPPNVGGFAAFAQPNYFGSLFSGFA